MHFAWFLRLFSVAFSLLFRWHSVASQRGCPECILLGFFVCFRGCLLRVYLAALFESTHPLSTARFPYCGACLRRTKKGAVAFSRVQHSSYRNRRRGLAARVGRCRSGRILNRSEAHGPGSNSEALLGVEVLPLSSWPLPPAGLSGFCFFLVVGLVFRGFSERLP
jgi:hypothetical protein